MTAELRLDLAALDHNTGLMARWCRERGLELCPHIKTTMTREIVERQLAAGAWGVTVATVDQAEVALEWGIRRIMIANEVVDEAGLARIRTWLETTPGLELYAFVDSGTGLARAVTALEGVRTPLRLLVDVGAEGCRTGVRGAEAASDLGRAVAAAPGCVTLAGVAAYEGVRPNRRDPATLAAVSDHCRTAVDVFRALAPLVTAGPPVFTIGGSAFPDLAADACRELADLTEPAEPGEQPPGHRPVCVLRSGCYVTHDHGTYQQVTPIPGLRPALTVRAAVVSAPEPGLAVVGAGKRELPHDAGLPVVVGPPGATGTAAQIFDHHLVLTDPHGLAVGDFVDLGISHPCSAFDKWREINVIAPDGSVHEVWRPRFRPS
ncbi:alanine racemase [Streptomyces morookaense]|uniref:Alanine racemase n=1 Tax=Streptomyces morookaense TaxID=1970 RepID=A0A7Y7AZX8_STRMO|nr:alanine racemase [Streptomyces morookaense]NVK76392.1 alanine racemase [Streptomyces morookaense]GHF06709.1 amino acid aldolase or racemase [Streptomyces morookaense]